MSDLSQRLRTAPNPFHGAVVGDPWMVSDSVADVGAIHRSVFDTCCQAVEEARHAPPGSSGRGLLIHGQPGSGKTHLIGRLRRRLIDDCTQPTWQQLSQAFAYVRLNTNPSSLARHVRRCVASDLLRAGGNVPCQLERMVISRLMEVAQGDGDMSLWREFLLDDRPDDLEGLLEELRFRENLTPSFTRVLGFLFQRQHRLDITNWLRGDPLTESAWQRLDLAPDTSDEDPELPAQRMLIDFMRLAGANVPLVLCFDQIEALQTTPDDREAFYRFGNLLMELADSDPNVVLISCLQSSRYELLQEAVSGAAHDRISSRARLALDPLNLDQASQLLIRRLAPLAEARPAGQSPLWPFAKGDLEDMVGPRGCSPRELIERAAQRFEALRTGAVTTVPPSVEHWFEEEWERREEHSQQSNTPEATAEILTDGIPRLLSVIAPDWKVASNWQGVAIDYILTAPREEARVGIKICEEQGNSLMARLRTLATLFPGKLNLHKLILLRDERHPISKHAVKTREHLTTLEKNDAIFLPVAPQTLAALDALRQLLSDAAAGDLACGAETITSERVLEWLRSHLPDSLKELAETLVTPSGGAVEEPGTVYLSSLQEWLSVRCLARWSDAMAAIEVGGQQADALLTAAEQRTDLFGVIHGEPTVVFSSRMSSPSLVAAGSSE